MPLKLVITWGDLGVHLGCVVRVESIGQDLRMSCWMSLARGGATWASPMSGTYGGYM